MPYSSSPQSINLPGFHVPSGQVGASRSQQDKEREKREVRRAAENARWAGYSDVTPAEGRKALENIQGRLNPGQTALAAAVGTPPTEFKVYQGAAVAGSGKTMSVVAGVAQGVLSGSLAPRGYMVTTFTRKGAEELQARCCRFIPKATVREMRIGTFHSLYREFLDQNDRAKEKNYWNLNNLITDGQPKITLREIMGAPRNVQEGERQWRRLPIEGMTDYALDLAGRAEQNKYKGPWEIYRKDLNEVAAAVEKLIFNQFRPWGANSWEAAQKIVEASDTDLERRGRLADAMRTATGIAEFPKVWELFRKWKQVHKKWDFSDVLDAYYALCPGDRVSVVVVDESQDNTWIQLQIAYKLAEANKASLVLVGDGRQSIYGFTGADPTIFIEAGEKGATKLDVNVNYRSGQWIIDLGNRIAEDSKGKAYSWAVGASAETGRRNPGGSPVMGNVRILEAAPPPGGKASSVGPSAKAAMIELAEAVKAGASPAEFAVLTRTNAALAQYELYLLQRKIPVAYAGSGRTFLDGREFRKLLGLLVLCSKDPVESGQAAELAYDCFHSTKGPWIEDRFSRITRKGFNEKFAAAWQRYPNQIGKVLREFGRTLTGYKSAEWAEDANSWAGELTDVAAAEWPECISIVNELLIRPKANKEEAEVEEDEIEALTRDADQSSAPEEMAASADLCKEYESYEAAVAFFDKARKAVSDNDTVATERVMLSTCHKSKGLEWSKVYLQAGSAEFPPPRDPGGRDWEESRRVFYVGATRAADELVIIQGTSPFVSECVRGWLLPRMHDAKLIAEQAAAGVEIVATPEGYIGVQDGEEVTPPVSTIEEAAAVATEVVEVQGPPFLQWLYRVDSDLAKRIAKSGHLTRWVEAATYDLKLRETLGWLSFRELLGSNLSASVYQRGRLLGVLSGGEPPSYTGSLPFPPFEVHPESPSRVEGPTYLDGSPELMDGRRQLAAEIAAGKVAPEPLPQAEPPQGQLPPDQGGGILPGTVKMTFAKGVKAHRGAVFPPGVYTVPVGAVFTESGGTETLMTPQGLVKGGQSPEAVGKMREKNATYQAFLALKIAPLTAWDLTSLISWLPDDRLVSSGQSYASHHSETYSWLTACTTPEIRMLVAEGWLTTTAGGWAWAEKRTSLST